MLQSALADKAEESRLGNPLRCLVENRTIYEAHEAELSIYDTYEAASRVRLDAEEILYCGMISGRKVLHGQNQFTTRFLPHESFVMAPGETVEIDFPDASHRRPTSCLAIAIRREKIQQVCDSLNHSSPMPKEMGVWRPASDAFFHGYHNTATQNLLLRIVESFMGKDDDRDLVLNLGVTELLTRLLRQQCKAFLLGCATKDPTHHYLNAVIDYIDQHLDQPLCVDQLCAVACMSRSKFYKQFAEVMGCGPMEYLQQRRLEKARQLIESGCSVTRACFDVGYVNPSHFCRRFQLRYGVSPRQYAAINRT